MFIDIPISEHFGPSIKSFLNRELDRTHAIAEEVERESHSVARPSHPLIEICIQTSIKKIARAISTRVNIMVGVRLAM